jgi:hypothetical protein
MIKDNYFVRKVYNRRTTEIIKLLTEYTIDCEKLKSEWLDEYFAITIEEEKNRFISGLLC